MVVTCGLCRCFGRLSFGLVRFELQVRVRGVGDGFLTVGGWCLL